MSGGRVLHSFTLMLVFSLWIQPAPLNGRATTDEDKDKSTAPGGSLNKSDSASLLAPMRPLISGLSQKVKVIDRAYLDAYTILSAENSCSKFFGGPYLATVILNLLYPKLKQTALDNNEVGIIMSGVTTTGQDKQTGVGFRLFENVAVNLKGPFFQSFNPKTHRFFNRVGGYPANTREARVVMLLHELGHLLPGSGPHWLLEDDANNFPQVMANTNSVLERCDAQVKSLGLQHTTIGTDQLAQFEPNK